MQKHWIEKVQNRNKLSYMPVQRTMPTNYFPVVNWYKEYSRFDIP